MTAKTKHLLKSIEKQVMLQDSPYPWPQSAPFSSFHHLARLARRITSQSRLTQDIAPRCRLQPVRLCVHGIVFEAAFGVDWPIILNALFRAEVYCIIKCIACPALVFPDIGAVNTTGVANWLDVAGLH